MAGAAPTNDNLAFHPPPSLGGYGGKGNYPGFYRDIKLYRRSETSSDQQRRLYISVGVSVLLTTIVVTIVGTMIASRLSGGKSTEQSRTKLLEVQKEVVTEIKLTGKTFTPELANKSTMEYKQFEAEFKQMMNESFRNSELADNYAGINIINVRNGSVIVESVIRFRFIGTVVITPNTWDTSGVTNVSLNTARVLEIVASTQPITSIVSVRNFCKSSPCVNGGSCASLSADFQCTCPPRYTGTICDQEMVDCTPRPCQNGGTCSDGVNTFTCDCTGTGFTGITCGENIDDCLPQPCKNGGICSDGVNTFTCYCTGTGFTGTTCSESTSCQDNEEVCVDLDGAGGVVGSIPGFSVRLGVQGVKNNKPCSREAVFKVTFSTLSAYEGVCWPDEYGQTQMLKISMTFSDQERSGWMCDVGDSISNNGAAGDSGHSDFAAEVNCRADSYRGILTYANIRQPETVCRAHLIHRFPDGVSSNVSTVDMYVANHFLKLTNDQGLDNTTCSECLFGLNAQYDKRAGGTGNQDIYISTNRVILLGSSRVGYGLCSLKMKWVTSPDE